MASVQEGEPARPSILSRLSPKYWWPKLELDSRTLILMLKGALAPTITIAIYQTNAISNITTTIGYLSALISVLSQGLMPRAKFIKIMFYDLLSTCVSASLCCLAVFCAVKAREHNTPPDATEIVRNGFNSDACAVAAIWLLFMIWAANSLRALKPMELQDPMVAFSIFASVTITRAGMFTTLAEGLEFVQRLLKGFLIGFAIATAVSLLIYPVTTRGDVFHDIKEYIFAIEDLLDCQIKYMSDSEPLTRNPSPESREMHDARPNLAASISRLNNLHSKLQADLSYSKQEVAWGKLSAKDLGGVASALRSLLLPLSGMSMVPEILEMGRNEGSREQGMKEGAARDENRRVETYHARLLDAAALCRAGLHYFLLALELIQAKHLDKHCLCRSVRDEEARGEALSPSHPRFAERFTEELRRYRAGRQQLPEALASREAFSVSEGDASGSRCNGAFVDPDLQQGVFLILYLGHLQDDMLNATAQLIRFADSKVADGTMGRNRLIFPRTSISEWLSLADKKETQSPQSSRPSSHVDADYNYRHTAFPDPEHLPPENVWEKSSSILRTISHAIKSEQSVFGFRVAAASFSVGILAFLHQTQDFFIRQRCIWAMIVIVIGMNPTSGQTMFGFVARILATVVSLALSLIVWYIVDGKTAGVIVFLYLANVFEYYFYIKYPQYFGASVVSIVTLNVIVGYELQVRKLGIPRAESNGQPYYPIYLFGPYKLAAVAAGCAISFFWVIFPYPMTAKSKLRRLVGRSLFVLAKFYSAMHTTIELWLGNDLGDPENLQSPGNKLRKTRRKIFKEEMQLLTALRMHSHFSSYEPAIGGKFPKQTYDSIISEVQRILNSMSLMAHTAQSLSSLPESESSESKWKTRLAEIAFSSADFNSHRITSLLCNLSAALTNAQPLPPYLSTTESFPLARRMQRIDHGLLDIRHAEDSDFSAFVALEILRSVVGFSLESLIANVRKLVGELSFEFDIRMDQPLLQDLSRDEQL